MCVDLIRRRLRLGPILGLAALGFAGCDSVSPSRVPTAVAFLTQPAGASGGTPFTTQPVVEVLDQNDERLAGTAVSVTVGLGSNPSGGQLLGVTTVITTTGLAAFGELGLTGKLRPATQAERRLEECAKLGLTTVLAPKETSDKALEVETIRQAIDAGLDNESEPA